MFVESGHAWRWRCDAACSACARRARLRGVESPAGRVRLRGVLRPAGRVRLRGVLRPARTAMHRLVAAAALLLPFSAIHEPLSAQRVTGRVVESGSGERVSTAQVSLVDEAGTTVRTAISDTAGYFVLDARRPGTYRLRAARIGYADYTSDRIDLQAGETVTVVVRLAAQGVPLQPLEVRARGVEERGRDGFERRRALVRGVFLTVDSIRLRDPVLVSDAFYGIPGVQVFEGLGPVQVFSMHGAKCFVMFRDHWPGGIGVGTMRSTAGASDRGTGRHQHTEHRVDQGNRDLQGHVRSANGTADGLEARRSLASGWRGFGRAMARRAVRHDLDLDGSGLVNRRVWSAGSDQGTRVATGSTDNDARQPRPRTRQEP